MIKPRRVRLIGHVAGMDKKRNTYRVLRGKKPL
jgi:hypothetical protein